LGINVDRTRIFLFILGSFTAAIAVSSCGIIGFVGLIVPHFCRLIVGTDHKKLIPISFIIGGGFLIIVDGFGRSIIPNFEIPIGALTSIIGGPIFLFVLRKKVKI